MRVSALKVGPPKSGRGPWWMKTGPDAFISFDPQKFDIKVGGAYDIEVKETEKNGRTYRDVIMCKPAMNGATSSAASGVAAPAGDRWWMPYVSNCCAHAIQAGLITEPMQLKLWAAAAKQAALEIDRAAKASAASDEREPPPYDDVEYA